MSDIVRTPETIAGEINFIKRQTSATCLNAAIEIGKLLVEAKSAVAHGEWGKWLETNVDYSQSTANGLMKLFKSYGEKQQLSAFDENLGDIFGALTPSQALALTALPEEKRVEYVQTHDVENESVREMKEQIEQLKRDIKQCENGYEQTLMLARNKLRDKDIVIKDKDKQIKKLKNDADASSIQANDYKKQADAANKRADNAEKQLGELIAKGEPATADMEAVRKEFEDEIVHLKKRLKNAENSTIQKFALYYEQFQNNFQQLWLLLDGEADKEVAEKFRAALRKAIENFSQSTGLNVEEGG